MFTHPPISMAGGRVPGRLGRVGVCLMHWQGAWVHRQFLRSSLTRKPTRANSNLDKSQWPDSDGAWYRPWWMFNSRRAQRQEETHDGTEHMAYCFSLSTSSMPSSQVLFCTSSRAAEAPSQSQDPVGGGNEAGDPRALEHLVLADGQYHVR